MFDPVKLAQAAVYGYLTGAVPDLPQATPAEFLRPGAAFVSLKIAGALRGCVGTFTPVQTSLAEEIIHNAIRAAIRDHRFSPLGLDEFEGVAFSVDVLAPPERVEDLDELDPRTFGLIVRAGHRKGLLLPDIEGVDSIEDQLAIAKRKAGIAHLEPVELFRFRVTRYK